jgi:hypothetical protein
MKEYKSNAGSGKRQMHDRPDGEAWSAIQMSLPKDDRNLGNKICTRFQLMKEYRFV